MKHVGAVFPATTGDETSNSILECLAGDSARLPGTVAVWKEFALAQIGFVTGSDLVLVDADAEARTLDTAPIWTFGMMEYIPWLGPIFENPVQVQDGYARVPQQPGAGTAIRAEAIERHAVS